MNRLLIGLLPLSLACAGLRYERGRRAFDEAQAPVHKIQDAAASDQVWIVVGVRAGSAHDPVGQEGLAWLTANVIREGGTQTLSAEEVDAQLTTLGATVSVMVDKELVGFRAQTTPEHAAQVSALLGEMLSAPALDSDVLQAIKARGLAWLDGGIATTDMRLASEAFEQWVFQGHPYGHPVQGRSGVLGTLDVEDVRQFFDGRYVRPAMAFGVTTGLAEADVDKLQTALSTRPVTLYRDVTPRPVAPVRDHRIFAVQRAGETSALQIGLPLTPGPQHPDWPALVVATAALSKHTGAKVNFWSGQPGSGRADHALSLNLSVDDGQDASEALKAAASGLSQWVADGVTAEALAAAKVSLVEHLKQSAADPVDRLAWAVASRLMGRANPLEVLPEAIDGLTHESVSAAVRRHVDPDALRVVVIAESWNTDENLGFEVQRSSAASATGLFR